GRVEIGVARVKAARSRPDAESQKGKVIFRLRFEEGATSLARIPSDAPTRSEDQVDDLVAVDEGNNAVLLTWHERNLGDYDNSGEVTIADVALVALFYLDKLQWAENPDQFKLIDGTGDGEVNIADVAPIAVNYLSAVAQRHREAKVAAGERVILVRKETNPEDVGGMYVAQGILTATGGKTSHAAVVARGWGKCCIVGCEALRIDYNGRGMMVGGVTLTEGDYITLDGSEGHVYSGKLPLTSSETPPEYNTLMDWCDRLRKLEVRANADTPEDARKAIELGAEGIGLCRTEHMFFDSEQRRLAMQEMIIAENESARREALDKLLPFQRDDFVGIFTAMDGRPVTVRLIDPPLHEFLPHTAADQENLTRASGVPLEKIQRRTEQLHETNPMLGHRGCRLSITYPEILEMQVTAIIEAAITCKRDGIDVYPEIMIPLTIDPKELDILVQRIRAVAGRIIEEAGEALDYVVGTMIETPRAALLGDRIAEVAEFFSFGTNDLTQTTLSLSRDDAGRFLPDYVDESKAAIFPHDPFQSLDVEGVGLLIKWCIERGRLTKPRLKIGVCGEHGGEARSVHFCHDVGMDYVSCSPFRVPIARLAAAQAAIQGEYGQAVQFPVPRRLAAAKAKPVRRKTASKRKKTTKKAAKKSKARKSGAKPGKKKKAPTRTKKRKPVKKTKPTKKSKSTRAKGKPKKKKTAKKRKR
ncbi:MAG: pyruvate, phosphate dikinase, partial [Planctomycetes bacterium]|nr:pyruvate, phosphate dikinase [Planctomycetota bacterium]